MRLRDYQSEAVEAVFSQWEGHRSTLLVMATGTGKTVVFVEVVRRWLEGHGGRALVLAHRGELLEQARDKLEGAGLSVATEKASEHAAKVRSDVVVGSVQTMRTERRLAEWSEDAFGLVVVDEAHHSMSDSYRKVLSHFGGAKVLGVTATPDRGDGKGLAEVFDTIAYEYGIAKAVSEESLVPIRAQLVPLRIDITGVEVHSGDYAASQLGNALDRYLPAIAHEIAERAQGRRTVVFLPLVRTAEKMVAALQAEGLSAREVDGESRDRDDCLEDFAAGRFQCLCNSMLLTEGWDCPEVSCVVVLRATKSRALYAQMVGRGTRPADGKDDLLLLDFLWQTERHDLCRPASLLSDDPDVQQAATRRLEEAGEVDVAESVEASQADAQLQREEALARELAEKRRRRAKLVDPVQFGMDVGFDPDASKPKVAWLSAAAGWDRPASEVTKAALETLGINAEGLTQRRADAYFQEARRRKEEGLASPKQVRLLGKYGFKGVEGWKADEAAKMVRRIAVNRWKVPRGVSPAEYEPKPAREDAVTFKKPKWSWS